MADDVDAEDLKAAIALSLASNESDDTSAVAGSRSTVDDSTLTVVKAALSMTQTNSISGMDRKTMEQERLARIATRKRERSISPPDTSRKAPKLEETITTLPSGAQLTMFSANVQEDQRVRKSDNANAANRRLKSMPQETNVKIESQDESHFDPERLPCGSVKYPNGVVKKTWAYKHPRTGTDIKIEEVLESTTLRIAVLSAFQWDPDWVLSKLKTPLRGGTTKCVFVMQAEDDEMRRKMLDDTKDQRHFLRLCFPSMEGMINCMHSKLMLLFHPDKLRIAVPSANLLNFDWGETGVMENSVFMIDLPRLTEGARTDQEQLTAFGKDLLYFLEKQGMDEDVRDGVLKFDFSATQQMAFVHTVGGQSVRELAERTGLPGLGRAIRQLNLESSMLELDFAASSIGALNDTYLQQFYAAARGEDVIKQARTAGTKAKADFFKPSAERGTSVAANVRDKLRIYFPTFDTVKASTAGSAGTICISRKYWEAKTFPRTIFRDYRSTRPGLLSHNKILCARGKAAAKSSANTATAATDVAWVYVGSANMSKSAWGEVVNDKKYKDWKVSCRNWECGVLLPVPKEILSHSPMVSGTVRAKHEKVEGEDSETESEDDGEAGDLDTLIGMEVFKGVLDVPFRTPGDEYGMKRPWYFMEDT